MGFFKKPVVQIDNDEEIRREIRARVAKQAGIYDEEYINTGKFGINTKVETPVDPIPAASDDEKADIEPTVDPIEVESEPDLIISQPEQQVAPTIQDKNKKPLKEKKTPKKKKINIALILFIIVLILAFIPLYYYLTGGNAQGIGLKVSSPDNALLLTEPLLVRGMATDSNHADGMEVYYSLDHGSATLLCSFEDGPGSFEQEIALPDTEDFLGEHLVTLYAESQTGELSGTTELNFNVAKPMLTDLKIKSLPIKVQYIEGELLDLTGLVVSASYEDGKTASVSAYTSDFPNGTKLSKPGEVTITISFSEETVTKTATLNVSVEKAAVKVPSKKINRIYPVPALEE